jgi:hypothetical protein
MVPTWIALAMLVTPCLDDDEVGFLVPMSVLSVAAMLCFEVHGISLYEGPLRYVHRGDVTYERATQVSAVFAVAATIASQSPGTVPKNVGVAIYAALMLCVFGAVPSSLARQRLGSSGIIESVQRGAVSCAAGLLCVVAAVCMKHSAVSP